MSEIYKPKHEVEQKVERLKVKERKYSAHEKEHHLKEKQGELSQSAKSEALPGAEVFSSVGEKNTREPSQHHVTKDIKKLTFNRTLTRVRKRENVAERTLSRVIHQPSVERVSEAAGRTVARPSGILGGGILAFVGTLALLYITRKYGYEFNYLVFIMLFVAGFALGAVIELLGFALRNKKYN